MLGLSFHLARAKALATTTSETAITPRSPIAELAVHSSSLRTSAPLPDHTQARCPLPLSRRQGSRAEGLPTTLGRIATFPIGPAPELARQIRFIATTRILTARLGDAKLPIARLAAALRTDKNLPRPLLLPAATAVRANGPSAPAVEVAVGLLFLIIMFTRLRFVKVADAGHAQLPRWLLHRAPPRTLAFAGSTSPPVGPLLEHTGLFAVTTRLRASFRRLDCSSAGPATTVKGLRHCTIPLADAIASCITPVGPFREVAILRNTTCFASRQILASCIIDLCP
mmetsp:Transcript_49614/g.106237  ORF Transcript_49614/g.106237 Transcript_49614/m.106237 type:complete len:283 (+) Transcript_49614:1675-2523(+)